MPLRLAGGREPPHLGVCGALRPIFGAVARFLSEHTDTAPFYVPINEISYLAWASGETGYIYPYARGRGHEIKRQLVRAAIAGMEAIWEVDPRARMLHVAR